MGRLTHMERDNLSRIKAKWDSLKANTELSSSALATAVALWATLNVDYIITLAERED